VKTHCPVCEYTHSEMQRHWYDKVFNINELNDILKTFIIDYFSFMGLYKRVTQSIVRRFPNWHFRKHTYSQAGEDAIVRFIFEELLFVEKPTYIDIGAYHPYHLSNTAIFSEAGSWGINIEPNPHHFKLFVKHRKNAINLNCGVGLEKAIITYYSLRYPTLNTFIEDEAFKYEKDIIEKIPILVYPLSEIIAKYTGDKSIDFLSLDVEGLDESIIRSIDFTIFKPKVMCIETVENYGNKSWRRITSMIDYIKAKGYIHYADTCINSIFIDKDLFPVALT